MYSSSLDKFYIITACCQNICGVASYYIQKGNNEHFHPKFSIIVFLIKKKNFFVFFFLRINKLVCDFLYWSLQKIT